MSIVMLNQLITFSSLSLENKYEKYQSVMRKNNTFDFG